MASTGAVVGGSLILITLLLMVVFLWNTLWRPFGAVMRKGHKRKQHSVGIRWERVPGNLGLNSQLGG